MKNKEIKNFLIINCIGKNDILGLKIDNNFFIKKIQTNIQNNNDNLVSNINQIIKDNNVNFDKEFSIIVNIGPGSFSSLRVSLAVAKGIKISKDVKLYGYKNSDLIEFNLKNIEFLIENNLVENKLIKPVYLS